MKTLTFFTVFLLAVCNLQSQKITETVVKMNHSKAALKASKKGLLYNAGFFWNKDKTQLYKLSTFTDRKTKAQKLEVIIYDSNGKFKEVNILPNNATSLEKFNIQNFETSTENTREQLNNLKVAYIKNPTLAGKPDIIKGSLKESYSDLGVFERFKFSKENSVELNEKFWAQVYYTFGDNVIDRNNYLIQPAPRKKIARAIFNMKKPFLPVNNQAYIGGLMAVRGSNVFLSGVLDLNTSKWLHKTEINLPHSIYPGDLNYIKLANNETGILIPSKDTFTFLTVNSKGEEKNKIALSIPKTGGQNGVQPSTSIITDNNSVLCFATTAKGMTGGNVGIAIAKITDGKEDWAKTYTNEDLVNKSVLPIKTKLKLKKFKMPYIESVEKLENDSYIAKLKLTKNTAKGSEKVFLLVHCTNNGNLIATYTLPAVKTKKENKLVNTLPIRLVKSNDNYFVVVNAEVDGYQKGQYTDVSVTEGNTWKTTTTESYRVDTSLTACYVVKINFNKKQASNVIYLEDLVSGEFPGITGQNNNLFLNSSKEVIIIK